MSKLFNYVLHNHAILSYEMGIASSYSDLGNTHFYLKNNQTAIRYFKKAIALGLSMDQDLALAKLQLAGIAMTRRRKMEATSLLNEAKKLDKQNMLKEQIKMMKDQMKKM